MDSSEVAHIFDAITGGTCAERFLSSLAATSPQNGPLASPDLPMPTPAFDMPLVAAQAPPVLDALPAPPSLAPHPFVPHPVVDLPYLAPEYSLPVSAVTGASCRSNSPSLPSDPRIHKKKRARIHRVNTDALHSLAAAVSAPNMSFASDSSTVAPLDDLSPRPSDPDVALAADPSTKPVPPRVKPEPAPVPPASCPARPARPSQPAPPVPTHVENKPAASSPPTAPKSHTRKCREKVTRQFEHLLEVLPRPPKGVEVKHKAQILDYTINIFRYLLLQRTALQAEIALASNMALTQWINGAITTATSAMGSKRVEPVPISAILEPFIGLYCVKKQWTYGELWLLDPESQNASLASYVFNTDDEAIVKRLDAFATESRNRFQAPSKLCGGMIARTSACQRPEWLDQPATDPSVFSRADIAQAHGIGVAMSVPVVLGKQGCAAVLLFADVKPHTFSAGDLDVIHEYAKVLGESYMQYVRGVQSRVAVPSAPSDGRMQAKPIRSADVKPPPPAPSVPNNEGRFDGHACGVYGLSPGIMSTSETSTRFFADSDMMGRRYS